MIKFHPATPEILTFFEPQFKVHICLFDMLEFYNGLFDLHDIFMPAVISNAFPKRKAEYLAGRICAKNSLLELGLKNQVLPSSNREPIWPEKIIGSISHSKNIAISIVTDKTFCSGVGVDVEDLVKDNEYLGMLPLIFSEFELIEYQNQINADFFTLIFSAKESFYKAVYSSVKVFIEFHALRLVTIEASLLTFEIQKNLNAKYQIGTRIFVRFMFLNDGHVLTFCRL